MSADSMQVYRGMDIGTGKLPYSDRGGVAHHMLDVADPSEEWDVARFASQVALALEGIESRGNRPLLVGGTGLYVHAVTDGFEVPGQWPEVRESLGAEASTTLLYGRLQELDPLAASRIEPGNRRRVLRALEVSIGSGRPFSSYGPGVGAFGPTDWLLAGIWLPRAEVARRIGQRFHQMLAAGLVSEVEGLAKRPEGLSRTARQALGYREILAWTEQGVPLEGAVAQAVQRTRQFARRQRMWWRRDPRVRWFGSVGPPLELLPALLENWADG